MHEMYQLVGRPTPYEKMFPQHTVAKLRLGNISAQEVRTALSRCSNNFNISVELDNAGLPGLVVKLCSTAPSMSAEDITELLEEMNTHLSAMRRARLDRLVQSAAMPGRSVVASSTKSVPHDYVNKPRMTRGKSRPQG